MKSIKTRLLVSAAALTLTAHTAGAVTIYQDDFNGSSGDINGLAPDIGANNWVAAEMFNADGSVDNTATTGGSMTLAFTPVDGLIYTLDASISGIVGDSDWFGMGFANGQSGVISSNTRFITGTVVGTAWMLFRGDNDPAAATPVLNVAQFGSGALNPPTPNGGLTSPVPWTALATEEGGDIDLRIVLDTTGGTGNWTATWYAKRPTDAGYSEVRASTLVPVASEANFTSVGIAISRADASGVDGTIESFSLTAVPEPGSLALLGLGGLLVARRRRA